MAPAAAPTPVPMSAPLPAPYPAAAPTTAPPPAPTAAPVNVPQAVTDIARIDTPTTVAILRLTMIRSSSLDGSLAARSALFLAAQQSADTRSNARRHAARARAFTRDERIDLSREPGGGPLFQEVDDR